MCTNTYLAIVITYTAQEWFATSMLTSPGHLAAPSLTPEGGGGGRVKKSGRDMTPPSPRLGSREISISNYSLLLHGADSPLRGSHPLITVYRLLGCPVRPGFAY